MTSLKWISVVFLKLLLLGSCFSATVQKKRLTLTQLKTTIEIYNQTASPMDQINSVLNYRFLYGRIPSAPSDPDRIYPDFKQKGGWKYLLGQKRKLTLDELKTAIAHYNKKALKVRQINNTTSYKKFHKYIPNSPYDPNQFYPDFKERGGWNFLFGKTCEQQFAKN